MNILLMGPQGSGKGTQARLLVEKLGFYYFESGEFLREIAEKNEKVRDMLSGGTFVPDKEMVSYVTAYLDEKGIYDNILFDGFPRSIVQYDFLKSWMSDKKVTVDLVLVLIISEEETIRRLSSRRQDPKTGKIYNLITDLPPDNIDKSALVQREDDKPEAIKKRLGWYKDLVVPLIAELKKETKVIEVNGERPIEEIQTDLVKWINSI
jgi:adenylate kinase